MDTSLNYKGDHDTKEKKKKRKMNFIQANINATWGIIQVILSILLKSLVNKQIHKF